MGFTITNKIFCRQTKRKKLLKKIGRISGFHAQKNTVETWASHGNMIGSEAIVIS